MEQNASVVALQKQFRALFEQGQERRKSLLDEQSKLNATRSSELHLKQRLEVAVNHLTKVKKDLQAQFGSARTFLETLSQRPIPGQGSQKAAPVVKKEIADHKDVPSAQAD